LLTRLLAKLVDASDREVKPLLWACLYFFLVLAAYFIIRPLRDEMGVAGGVRNLPWLFSGTLLGMLAVHPLFTWLVGRLPRRRFITTSYRFFMVNLAVFFVLLKVLPATHGIWVGRAFYIWVSVFNLFVVSVFWSLMADVFRPEQGRRLFGFIAVGGTLGAVTGSTITATLVEFVAPVNLLLISLILLELAVQCVGALLRTQPHAVGRPLRRGEERGERDPVIGGSVVAGVTTLMRSPYLLGICGYMLLYTVASTFLYFQQAEIVARVFEDRVTRTAFFARIDLAVNILTVIVQVFLTGRIVRWLGIALSLAVLPAVCIIGFTGLGFVPTLAALAMFQVVRRATNYSVSRPTREMLYTVVPRESKYKAKNFIDTFVYRAGDQIGAWSYALMGWVGLGATSIALAAVPLSGVWVALALWVGAKHRQALATLGEEECSPLSRRAT